LKRYILYNNETGDILHTHQVFRLGSDEPEEVSEEVIQEIAGRFAEPRKIKVKLIDEPYLSSEKFSRKIDVKIGKLVTTEAKVKAKE
jgi:RNA-binding protein YhbY